MNTSINKGKIIYTLFIISFIIYLIQANNIVAYLIGENVEIVKYEDLPLKDRVEFVIDQSYVSGSFTGKIYYKGWAFCETEEDNKNKEISLIFVSDGDSYRYTYKPKSRPDVPIAFPTKEVKGNMHGFAGEFSTVLMKDGIYKLYIFDWENEKNYGIVDTGRLYKKDANGIREFIWSASKVDLDLSSIVTGNIKSNIEAYTILNDGSLKIMGWAFINEMNSKNQKVYLEITDKNDKRVYNTLSKSRYDVVDAFQNEKYWDSGFNTQIPENELENGEITIQIYIENAGKIYRDEKDYKFLLKR